MTRKIIFIIIGAILFLLLLGILWFWLLHRAPADTTAQTSGFGTSTDKAAANANGQGSSNTGADVSSGNGAGASNVNGVGPNVSAGGINVNGSGIGVSGSGAGINGSGAGNISTAGSGINTGPQASSTSNNSDSRTGSPNPTGGTESSAWVGGGAVVTREFTPAQINQINSTQGLSGTPLISTTPQAAGLSTSALILGASAAGCAAQYLANELLAKVSTVTDGPTTIPAAGPYVVVFDYSLNAKANANKFTDIQTCLVKTIAQAAIDQITRSVVAWINSGFNGQPSFVTNFNQYFANVADQAAGEFIKGSSLSFLCSAFAPQIKIAIAQSYANRNNATSCSLTKVINNINGFLGGNWGAGGWGGLLQLTTVPTNNPYGALAYAQIGLQSSISQAQSNARGNVSPGGFISLQKQTCDAVPVRNSEGEVVGSTKANCKSVTTTPGAVIEDSLKNSLNNPIQGLNLAQNINSIITALTNQVMIKTLYGGLGGAITNPLAPAIDQGASAQAQTLLGQLQNALTYAGQYGGVEQGSISDIQNAQAGLNTAFNCWSTAASSTSLTADQHAQASQNAAQADAAQTALGTRIDAFNNEITRANVALGTIQNLQSQVLFAATPDDVNAAAQAVASAQARGAFLGPADITTAQQNRTTLQADLAARNQQTSASLAQCRALGV